MAEEINESSGVTITTLDLKKDSKKKNRIWEIDFFRGIAIILMVLDHLMWNIAYFTYHYFDVATVYASGIGFVQNIQNENGIYLPSYLFSYMQTGYLYYTWDFRIALRMVILIIFFAVCGISFKLSKNNLKRGLILLGFGLLITLVTAIGCSLDLLSISSSLICFGVLSCYGTIIIITHFLKKLVLKLAKGDVKKWYFTSIMLVLLILFGYIFIEISGYNYQVNFNDPLSFFIGIIGNIIGFSSFGGDYFPLLPYFAYFLVGELIGETIYKNRESLFKKNYKTLKPVTFIGRNTLWVYVVHIPLITLIHAILYWSAGYNLALF